MKLLKNNDEVGNLSLSFGNATTRSPKDNDKLLLSFSSITATRSLKDNDKPSSLSFARNQLKKDKNNLLGSLSSFVTEEKRAQMMTNWDCNSKTI
jgi:hypothetical protein